MTELILHWLWMRRAYILGKATFRGDRQKNNGEGMLLGVSAASVREAVQAQNDGADYLGIGAMFPTDTKTDAGLVTKRNCRKSGGPFLYRSLRLAGSRKENAEELCAVPVDGLAVVSAIIAQPDIKQAAAELRGIFRKSVVNR